MDLRQLRYFVAVARERNVTSAAESLHITQPPLSRQIQMLEEELGVPLLVRSSRPLRLTDAGRLLYEQALQILGRVDQMAEATRRVGKNERSVLSIGFVASTLYGGLPKLIRELRQQMPEVNIQLLELTSVQQIEALKSGRIDVGFGRIRSNDPGVKRIVLREEPLILASPRHTALATSDKPVSLTALGDAKLIVYPKEPRPSFADHVLTLLHDHSVYPAEVHEVRELQTALGLVAAEVGVCIIPASVRLLRSDLHYREIQDKEATSPVILMHRMNDTSRYIDVVRELSGEM